MADPDFPTVNCVLGICTIAYEGTKVLARDKIKRLNANRPRRTVSIIIADFPGEDLIYEIVRNPGIETSLLFEKNKQK